jgi:hypothetical protein
MARIFMNSPQKFITAYETALATQSWEKVAPLIHERCVATFGEGTFIGKVEAASAFRRTFSLIKEEKYTIGNIHWIQVAENLAAYIFRYSWSGIIDHKFASGSGRGMSLLSNDRGRWQLICEHLGPAEKP